MHLIQDLQPKLQKTGERLRHFLVSKTPQIKTLLKDIALAGLLLWLVLSYLENASQGSVSDYFDPSLPFYFSAISFSAIIFLQKLSPSPQKKQTRQKPGKAQNTKTPQKNFLSRIFPGLTRKKKFLLLKDIFIASLLLNLAILYLEWASSGSAENLLTPAGITAFQFISAASLFLLAFLKQKENLRKASSKTGTIIDKSIDFIAAKIAKLLQTEYLFLASLALLAIINTLKAFEIKTALTQSDLSEKTVFLASFIAIATGAALIIKNRDKIDLETKNKTKINPKKDNSSKTKISNSSNNFLSFLQRKKVIYSIIISIIIIFGFFLRIYQLDQLSPTRDEYNHLNAAKHLSEEGVFNYSRAPIITYATYWSWNLFNNGEPSVSWGRFISAILGTLSIPLTFIIVKINSNRKIAIIAAFLIATSPFHIGISRYLREYILFFDLLIVKLIFTILIYKNIRRKNIRKTILYSVLLSPFLLYYFLTESSTYTLNFAIWLFFSLLLILNVFIKKRKNIVKFLYSIPKTNRIILISLIIFVFLLTSSITYYSFGITNKHFQFHELNDKWFNMLFSSQSSLQWFSGTLYPTAFIVIIFMIGLISGCRNVFLRSLFLTLVFLLVFYSFFFDRYFAPRYAFLVQLFVVILFSYSIHSLYSLTTKIKKNKVAFLILTLFILSIFNPIYPIKSVLNEKNGIKDPKNDLTYRDTHNLIKFLDKKGFSKKDLVLTKNNGVFAFFYDYPFLTKKNTKNWNCIDYKFEKDESLMYDYSKTCQLNKMKDLKKTVSSFDSGWIVIDKDNNRHWRNFLKTEDFFVENTLIHYLGSTSATRGYDIYKWNENND